MKRILLLIATSTISAINFAQGCTDLYFSEYIEGSGINKALEIYNPSGSAIDLSTYRVELYVNGSATTTTARTLNLVGTLNAGEVYVIANASPQIDAAITAQKDTTHEVCSFNGDDALALFNGSTQIDGIGVIGTDPGSSWVVDTGATEEYTLVRKANITSGNTTWTGAGDTEWTAYSQNDFSYLGAHTTDGCVSSSPLVSSITISEDTICLGSSINYSISVSGGTAPYSVSVDFGDGSSSSTLTGSQTYNTANTYTLVYTVSDDAIPSLTKDSTITIVVAPCSSISEEEENSVQIFPNPSKDGLVSLSNVKNNSSVTVYNVIGEIVYSNNAIKNKQLNLSNLTKGSYFIVVANDNNKITKKLIIQ
jgi:hypothetical protein